MVDLLNGLIRGSFLSHVGQVDQVVALGLDAQVVGFGLVERTLPKHGGVVGRIYQVVALDAGGPEVEERYLLTLRGLQQGVAAAGDEGAPVGDGYGLHAHLQVVDQEGDVAQGVVVAASGDAQHHESAASALSQVAHGLAEVVGFLFINPDELQAVALGQSRLDGVAVADDQVGPVALLEQAVGGAVEAYHEGRPVYPSVHDGGRGKLAVGYDDGFGLIEVDVEWLHPCIIFFHFKYPNTAMTA